MSEPAKALTDESPMPFGQYGPKKGDHRKLRDVPAKYLLWLWDDGLWQEKTGWKAPLHYYVAENFNALLKDAPDYIPGHLP